MAMMTPLALKTDFGDQCFTPFANLFSPKTFSLSSPLATNLFEDLAVKDGNLCFDNLDFAGPTYAGTGVPGRGRDLGLALEPHVNAAVLNPLAGPRGKGNLTAWARAT